MFCIYIYIYNKCWFVGHYLLLLRDFGPYVIIFMELCIITVAMVS
jgi:hypothetical protein